jgi:hypothetical protein
MEAEPEMFGAAVAAPEDATRSSAALSATRLERRTWSTLLPEAVAVPSADHEPAIDGGVGEDPRSASSAGRALVGAIALVQVIWWAALAYLALRLFFP